MCTVLTTLFGLVPSASVARRVTTRVPGGEASGRERGGTDKLNTGGLSLASSTVTNTVHVDCLRLPG